MDDVNNAHDVYFKKVFSVKENAADLLNGILPDELSDINLKEIVLEDVTFTDDKLREHFCDIIYSTRFGKENIYIAFLLEHKSYYIKHPHLQLLQYILNGINVHIDQKKGKSFPVIIPVFIYHGKRRMVYKDFFDYYGNIPDALEKYIPGFDYIFMNVTPYAFGEQRLKKFDRQEVRSALLIERDIHNPDKLLKILEKLIKLCQIYNNEEFMRFVKICLIYILSTKQFEHKKQEVKEILVNGGIAVNLIDEWKQEGIEIGFEKGIKKGLEKGRLETAKKMLHENLDLAIISKITGYSADEIRNIQNELLN